MCKSKRAALAVQPTGISADDPTRSPSSSSTLSLRFRHDEPVLYPPSEIPSSSAWPFRCRLGGRDVVVFQQRFHGDPLRLPSALSSVAPRGRHRGLARLLGASLPAPDSLLLVYERVRGCSLAHSLRGPGGGFTTLSSWASRIQIAVDVAKALEYVHDHAHLVHCRVDASAVVVTDPDNRAKLCHFGAAELSGGARRGKVDARRGYLSPEMRSGSEPSRGSDVYAFGVVLLELVKGEEPVRCFQVGGELEIVSLVESARAVVEEGMVRRWVDRRLRDSFPLEVVEKAVMLAVECTHEEEERRPEMAKVAAKLSRLLSRSCEWANTFRPPVEISVSGTPR